MDTEAQLNLRRAIRAERHIAELRKLTRQYVRGALSRRQFITEWATVVLLHDVDPEDMDDIKVQDWLDAPDDGATFDMKAAIAEALHNPSCGCDWCQAESVGRYTGVPPADTFPTESKAEE